MISQQMEEYLEAIGKLEERGDPVTTSALARKCRVAPPTVTEMLHRLTEQGLIRYEPRKEVALTEAGRRLSATVIRRHRLWERFLQDVLGLKWDQVHEQACLLEHATLPELERHLEQAVGDSDTCPHGYSIPGVAQPAEHQPAVSLASVEPGQAATIVSVEEDAALLRQLAAVGIRPGAVVRVEEVLPESGGLTLTVGGQRRTLDRVAAAQVTAKLLTIDEAEAAVCGPSSMALGDLAPGETATVRGFLAGRGLMARCLALGFTPGAEVQMVQNLNGGPIIVLVRDTRVALGRGEASKVYVNRRGGTNDRGHQH
jgi:DtxR family transcriptional regulator, Mn-dependent transcriptional regulator